MQDRPGSVPASTARGRTVAAVTSRSVPRQESVPVGRNVISDVSGLSLVVEDTSDRDRRCKKRPDGRKGSGGSRPFVPWCK